MELSYTLIAPLVVNEKWFHDTVKLSFKATNQEWPIEVLGYFNPETSTDENEVDDIPALGNEKLKEKTILNTFKTIHFYYAFDGDKWNYIIP